MSRKLIISTATLLAIAFAVLFVHIISNYSSASIPKSMVYSLESKVSSPEQRFLLNGPIDIDEATPEDLDAIPYVGPSLADKIIEFRAKRGKITNLDELLDVKGIGPKKLERIRPYLKGDARSRETRSKEM